MLCKYYTLMSLTVKVKAGDRGQIGHFPAFAAQILLLTSCQIFCLRVYFLKVRKYMGLDVALSVITSPAEERYVWRALWINLFPNQKP